MRTNGVFGVGTIAAAGLLVVSLLFSDMGFDSGESSRSTIKLPVSGPNPPRLVEIGDVPVFSTRFTSVAIENTTASTIEIGTESSCGCMVAELRDTLLFGHSQTKLDILFSPRDPTRLGRREESVRIMFRQPDSESIEETLVHVVADIETLVDVSPPRIDFGSITDVTAAESESHRGLLISADESAWNGLLEISTPVSLVTRVEHLPAAQGKRRSVVYVGVNADHISDDSKFPEVIAEVLRVKCVVDNESLNIAVPVTGRFWRGGCYAQPVTCYVGCFHSKTLCTAAFSVTDTRPAPNWASVRVHSDSLAIGNVRTRPLTDRRMRFEVDFEPIETKSSHHIVVLLSDKAGTVSSVPVTVVSYFRNEME